VAPIAIENLETKVVIPANAGSQLKSPALTTGSRAFAGMTFFEHGST